MKRIISILSFSALLFNASAEGIEETDKMNFYAGVSLDATSDPSEYNMSFTVNQVTFPGAGGFVKHKKNINKLGYTFFVGFSGGEKYYYALEAGIGLKKHKYQKDLSDREALEVDVGARNGSPQTSLKFTLDNEYNFALKFGKRFNESFLGNMCVYGILGASVREFRVDYNYVDHAVFAGANYWRQYQRNFKKHIWAFSPGLGAEFKICKNFSMGLEYKHKFYQGINKTIDLQSAALVDLGGARGDYDTSPRGYKMKTSQDSLSLRFIVNI